MAIIENIIACDGEDVEKLVKTACEHVKGAVTLKNSLVTCFYRLT